jgi:hypothetical protein
MGRAWRRHAPAFAAYVAAAVVMSWPLPLHLGTHLPGPIEGDTSIYVWNLWVFSHEIFANGASPLRTMEILPLAGPTDLSLHNYTVFSNLLAMPLLNWLGLVRTFNVVYLLNAALAGFGLYLLAFRLTRRIPESFVAGLMFAWAPFLVTRGSGHFSLAAAAPLPIFMLVLHWAWDTQQWRHAALAGVVLAWAAFSDPYYAIYCLLLAACFLASRVLAVTLVRRPPHELRTAKQLVYVGINALVALVIGVRVLGGGVLELGTLRISMQSLHTPMLILTTLVLIRVALAARLRVALVPSPSRGFAVRATAAAAIAAGLLMSPTLYAVGARLIEGRMPDQRIYWRSSAQGVDVLSFLAPNPHHPLAPAALTQWLDTLPGFAIEQVASLSWVGLLLLFVAWGAAGFRPGRLWIGVGVVFGAMATGPFLQVAGINTLIPGPWSVLRYAPIVGAARMPGRFSIIVMLAFCVLCAYALVALTRRYPDRRRAIVTLTGVLVACELLPAPRPIYPAELPPIFDVVRADPRPVRVLELPTGVKDGLAPLGKFSPATQFRQALHGKGVIGGYVSRLSEQRKEAYRRMPVTSALLAISEGRRPTPAEIDRAIAGVDEFVRATNLGYVVMDRSRVSDDLRHFAMLLLGLTKIDEAGVYELYVPRDPGRSAPPSGGRRP